MGRQSFIAFVIVVTHNLFSGGIGNTIIRYVGELRGQGRERLLPSLVAWGWKTTSGLGTVAALILVALAASGAQPTWAWLFAAVAAFAGIVNRVPGGVLIGTQRWRSARRRRGHHRCMRGRRHRGRPTAGWRSERHGRRDRGGGGGDGRLDGPARATGASERSPSSGSPSAPSAPRSSGSRLRCPFRSFSTSSSCSAPSSSSSSVSQRHADRVLLDSVLGDGCSDRDPHRGRLDHDSLGGDPRRRWRVRPDSPGLLQGAEVGPALLAPAHRRGPGARTDPVAPRLRPQVRRCGRRPAHHPSDNPPHSAGGRQRRSPDRPGPCPRPHRGRRDRRRRRPRPGRTSRSSV